jgi:Potential Queuosine, Q, salvage protein family
MMGHGRTSLPDRVRAACAWVAARARSVRIEDSAVETYVETLTATADQPTGQPGSGDPEVLPMDDSAEKRAAFAICMNAINFGSGWWPTIRKRPGHSGYATIAAGMTERFREHGAWPVDELREIGAPEIAAVTGQDPDHPLMADFAAALRDVGEHVRDEHGGSFRAVAEAADGSVPALAGLLAGWGAFADESTYEGRPVPFFKRAQLAAADLERAGVASLSGSGRLTAFADNLVPHVLRLDGVLRLDPVLEAAIEAGCLLEHGSAEEVELRACAVHAVELLADATDRRLCPAEIDLALWTRGGQPRYKAVPRPRSRNTAY